MSGVETARFRVVQRRIGGAETTAPKWPSPIYISTQEDDLPSDLAEVRIYLAPHSPDLNTLDFYLWDYMKD